MVGFHTFNVTVDVNTELKCDFGWWWLALINHSNVHPTDVTSVHDNARCITTLDLVS